MDVSTVDFETLKCSQCRKYLSVPPIYVYPDSTGKDQNVCGRCKLPAGMPATRNTTFESLAKFLKFPCSASENCEEKLTWDRATAHEATCPHREIHCPLCTSKFLVTGLPNHFKDTHSKYYFHERNLTISETDLHPLPSAVTCLVNYPNVTCLVTFKVDWVIDNFFEISVEPIFFLSKPHVFSVTFSNDDSAVCFKNNQIKKSYRFDMRAVLDIVKITQKEFVIDIEIVASDSIRNRAASSQQSTALSNNDSEDLTILKGLISDNLNCQICAEIMLTNIYTCERGHSICDFCKQVLTVCRLCQGSFLGARNFALEEISRTFASISLK